MTNQEFTKNVQDLENLLFAFALRLTRSRQDAEDLMQETSIKAFRHKDKFTPGTNFKSWISTIMRNTFINNYRKAKSRRHINQPATEVTFAVEVSNTIGNNGEDNLRMAEITKMMKSMRDIYSVPFMMFYQGYEYKEISEYLDIPIGTVKSRIFLARTKMKNMIGRREAA